MGPLVHRRRTSQILACQHSGSLPRSHIGVASCLASPAPLKGLKDSLKVFASNLNNVQRVLKNFREGDLPDGHLPQKRRFFVALKNCVSHKWAGRRCLHLRLRPVQRHAVDLDLGYVI